MSIPALTFWMVGTTPTSSSRTTWKSPTRKVPGPGCAHAGPTSQMKCFLSSQGDFRAETPAPHGPYPHALHSSVFLALKLCLTSTLPNSPNRPQLRFQTVQVSIYTSAYLSVLSLLKLQNIKFPISHIGKSQVYYR